MSLSIHDIERSIGIDLLRRPFLTSTLNAAILCFFHENLALDPDAPPPAEGEVPSILDRPIIARTTAALTALLARLVSLIGVLESLVWIVIAIFFKVVHLPRIYAFEKLILDLRVAFSKPSLRYIDKSLRFHLEPAVLSTTTLPRFSSTRQGIAGLVITTVKCTENLSNDAIALFKLLRYSNDFNISYFHEDVWVVVGFNAHLIGSICSDGKLPVKLKMGWHRDCVENTIYKIDISFVPGRHYPRDTDVKYIGRRSVSIEVFTEFSSENLQLVAHMMDQFAAVGEGGDNWSRFFNGKRMAIYAVGLILALFLIVFYEGRQGLTKPSIDVVTLAVGAFTLWMTVGKSAALGETVESVYLDVERRQNFLLSYHGQARVSKGMVNTCWIPEIHRPIQKLPRNSDDVSSEAAALTSAALGKHLSAQSTCSLPPSSSSSSGSSFYEIEDASITRLEAAVCLGIHSHFGHFLKWKGKNLLLDHYEIEDEGGLGHIKQVNRIESVQDMKYSEFHGPVLRLGGTYRSRKS